MIPPCQCREAPVTPSEVNNRRIDVTIPSPLLQERAYVVSVRDVTGGLEVRCNSLGLGGEWVPWTVDYGGSSAGSMGVGKPTSMLHMGSLSSPTVALGLNTISALLMPKAIQLRGWWRP